METKTTTGYVYENVSHIENADASRKFIANVFLWMFVALCLSAFCAYIFAFNRELSSVLRDPETGRNNIYGTIVMFSPLIIAFAFNKIYNSVGFVGLVLVFLLFAALMGTSLSFIFYAYSLTTVYTVFITTAVVFGVMAVGGYITHQDLTKFGSLLIMLLIGIIIASFVNILLLHSSGLDLIISYAGAAIFIGLTAYDVQKLKRIGAGLEYGDASGKKMAIMGALTLYLDFVNLFLFLLRIFGGNRR
ncbi:Bax inhibitor-1/YccA family protein [Mucilaginibacter glaciei]|uniref:Bax inhibitor-1/YccA family protein n=1 Tax=Mucilaginibacter glaciei TaxID=2772109 RepID=A0A926S1J5_9SPHI|nr:Bax inhibitor-1/YccA family protein [Mucilaginibacter glaciei]MBD1392877.1 Bax inhibitor-1/YccA family protein [Mucilaginibacter glaciei]